MKTDCLDRLQPVKQFQINVSHRTLLKPILVSVVHLFKMGIPWKERNLMQIEGCLHFKKSDVRCGGRWWVVLRSVWLSLATERAEYLFILVTLIHQWMWMTGSGFSRCQWFWSVEILHMDSLYFTISQELAQEWKVLYTTILYILSVHRRPAAAHSCRVYYTLRFTDDIIFCQMMFCSIACEEFSLSVPVIRIFTV